MFTDSERESEEEFNDDCDDRDEYSYFNVLMIM